MSIKMKKVCNKPPYQHHRASPDYYAARGEFDVPGSGGRGKSLEVDLLFTPTEVRRAARRALMNREDIPQKTCDSLWRRIIRVIRG